MEASLAPRRRTSPLSRELKSRGKRQGGSEGRAHFRGRVRWPAECVGCPEERGRYHVPDRPPPPQSPFWQTVDWEAPAAADRVFPREAEYDPSPGDRGGEPLLAEHALSYRGAGVRPRRGAQGGGLRGHQGGQHVQVPPRQICGRPARPSQCHQEVVLTRNHHLSVGRITGLPPLDPILEPKNCNLWGEK